MNRRSFMASMAAAFGAATIGNRLAFIDTPPTIDYSLFVDPDTNERSRYDLRHPFSVGGAVYASDRRIIITHPGEWSGEATGRVPDVGKLWWDEFDKPGWKPLGRAVAERTDNPCDCPVCHGYGVIGPRATCQQCDGDEWRMSDNGDLVTCRQCVNGYIGTPCAACVKGGVSYFERIGGAAFGPDYTARLRTLGSVDYRVVEIDSVVVSGSVLFFRGGHNVRGMVCGFDL